MKIHRPNPQMLIIAETRLFYVGKLVFFIAFFGFWYYFMLDRLSIPEDAEPVNKDNGNAYYDAG